jgi:hypothetical protein
MLMKLTAWWLIPMVLTGLAAAAEGPVVRHWQPFQASTLTGAYISVIARNRQLELWREANPSEQIPWRRLLRQYASTLEQRDERQTVLDAALIDDVYDPERPGQLSASRLFTRSSVDYHPGFGYTLLAGVIHEYRPGELPLLPALFVSPDGNPGSWRYRGQLSGEPAALATQRYIWSDGGSVIRMADGSWRIYLNGYGVQLAVLQSNGIDGPWRFLRTADGSIRELAGALIKSGAGGHGFACPTVMRIDSNEWHAWLSEGWPVVAIWHLWSADGLQWQLYGTQPEITPATFGGKIFKNIRVYRHPGAAVMSGLVSVWDRMSNGEDGWLLYRSELPVGRPPAQ